MSESSFDYVIVGGGMAGASAVAGIREADPKGSILLISAEEDLPYDRPPLTKQLWTGKTTIEKTIKHNHDYYKANHVELRLGATVKAIDAAAHTLRDSQCNSLGYRKLLLATGGTPRKLDIPGGDNPEISYYRTLKDFRSLKNRSQNAKSALIIGGGFIGSELAASMCTAGLKVTMVFHSHYLVSKVFPKSLAKALTEKYQAEGITIHGGDSPVSITHDGGGFTVKTKNGLSLKADLLAVGIGIAPNVALAESIGLKLDHGIVVNEYLQTSNADIYAAGDVARFPLTGFGPRRLEHYDNATSQGKHAGKNMAGAHSPFTYVPLFYSDLFDFGYEAVGDVDSRLKTVADWKEPNKTGVIYYLNDKDQVRGAMLCNVWDKIPDARKLIQEGDKVTPESLKGAIG